jgi:DNA-binding transcriptional LysR family regulator
MDAELIQAFLVIADNLSFTRAAEQLGTSQPQLSRAIRRLEDVVGEELIDRSRRQIELTPSGHAFRGECQGILDRIEVAVQRARRAGHGSPGLLRIGFTASAPSQPLRHGLIAFREMHPEVRLHIEMMKANEQADALRSGELDVGLFLFNNTDRRELTWRTIARSGFVMALPASWGFPKDQPIRLESLRDAPFILSHPDVAPQLHAAHMSCCDAAGFRPKIVRYVRDSIELRFLVACGLGVGFAYETSLNAPVDGIQFLPIADGPESLAVEFHIAWLADRPSRLVLDLIACMQETSREARIVPTDGSFGLEWTQARL